MSAAEVRAALSRLGVAASSIGDEQLREIFSSASSGSSSGSGSSASPGSAPSGLSTSGGSSQAGTSALSTTSGGAGGGSLSGTDDGLSLPSELLAELASPAPVRRSGLAAAAAAAAASAAAAPQHAAPLHDLRLECVCWLP